MAVSHNRESRAQLGESGFKVQGAIGQEAG